MALSKEERIELVLLSGREGWSHRKIAEEFNLRHPHRQPIYFTAVGKLIKKFKETGSVLDKPRSGRPRTSDKMKMTVMAKVNASPKNSLRQTSTELGIPRSTIHKMLIEEKFHPGCPNSLGTKSKEKAAAKSKGRGPVKVAFEHWQVQSYLIIGVLGSISRIYACCQLVAYTSIPQLMQTKLT
ncbi:hypothetical protein SK128_005776 [Halocaridina rubra]|uniref:DUF4817 domain-containing protein n=1 Tax=Halocaridina rubra TaxID=373956 RepID=A0AAN8WLJ4_HALRR